MKIEVNIEKRHFYVLVLLVSLAFIGFAIAYGTSQPSTFGHSILEIENATQSCTTNPSWGGYLDSGQVSSRDFVCGAAFLGSSSKKIYTADDLCKKETGCGVTSPACVLCDGSCGSDWPNYVGQIDGGSQGQITYGSACDTTRQYQHDRRAWLCCK